MSNSFQNIFDKFVPMWRNTVSRYARNIWNGIDDDKSNETYDKKALYFSREYRHELEKYYREKGMKVYSGTLDGTVWEWLKKQQALKDTLKVITSDKKNTLIEKEIEKLRDTKDAQAMVDKLYDVKKGETVYKVFSFSENFKDLAEQHGEEAAFDLGTGINERIIQHFSDRYFWRHQKDKRVRFTHFKLGDLCFLFADPPTTIDKYGNVHKGNPGTDFGCRCWADIAPEREKVLRNYKVYENEHKK